MTRAGKEFQHMNPVWHAKSDFIIGVDVSDHTEVVGDSEQLWARQLAEYRFEICCVPFFTYGIALGDEVETDATYTITRVSRPSGRQVFRIWFGEISNKNVREVLDSLHLLDVLMEFYSEKLLAVDASDVSQADLIVGLLDTQRSHIGLEFESGASG